MEIIYQGIRFVFVLFGIHSNTSNLNNDLLKSLLIFRKVPGGWIASRYGGKWVLGIGILSAALLTIITPESVRSGGIGALIALRILVRISIKSKNHKISLNFDRKVSVKESHFHRCIRSFLSGLHHPNGNLTRVPTYPLTLRLSSRMTSIVYSGAYAGTIIVYAISGKLVEDHVMGGWPSIFYIFGILGVVWFVLWIAMARDSPWTDKGISIQVSFFQLEIQFNLNFFDI